MLWSVLFSFLRNSITLEYIGCEGVTTSAGWLHTLRRYCKALDRKGRMEKERKGEKEMEKKREGREREGMGRNGKRDSEKKGDVDKVWR